MWISINEQDSRPLYQQIMMQVREQVGNGTLKAGDELPSVRELADSLGVNMHTVRNAYLKLRDQGIIRMRLGRRARIAEQADEAPTGGDEADIISRLRELITDATLSGFSAADFRSMVDRELTRLENER